MLTLSFIRVQADVPAPPQLDFVYPLGAQPGSVVAVEFKGKALERAYAPWFGDGTLVYRSESPKADSSQGWVMQSSGGFIGHVMGVSSDSTTATVQLSIPADAKPGFHKIYLLSPAGLSNPLPFWVGPYSVVEETRADHGTPDTAQPLSLPVAVNGRIRKSAELDYFAFEVTKPQTLEFEVVALQGREKPHIGRIFRFEPRFELFDTKGSWLDPNRANRLLFNEEKEYGFFPPDRRVTYDFKEPGKYVISICSIFSRVFDSDYSYLFSIRPVGDPPKNDPVQIARAQLEAVLARRYKGPAAELVAKAEPAKTDATGAAPAEEAAIKKAKTVLPSPEKITAAGESEPNNTTDTTQAITIPSVLSGAVAAPGDVDCFKFKIVEEDAKRLAFEIQTPDAKPPLFNPRLDILDSTGKVLYTNVGSDTTKYLNPASGEKAVIARTNATLNGEFEKGREYVARIQDVTSTAGNSGFQYRLLVRPQVPHLGEIQVWREAEEPDAGKSANVLLVDRINLAAGVARQFTISAPSEEGFNGQLAVSVEGLPKGVKAFFSAESHHEAKKVNTSQNVPLAPPPGSRVIFMTEPDAPAMTTPQIVHLTGRPIIDGIPGEAIGGCAIPLMVVKGEQPK